MNARLTIALLVVFVALGVVAFVSNHSGTSSVQGTPTPNAGVFSFPPANVQKLTIEYTGKSITVQQDASGQWQLVNPKAQYSDSTHIAGVVATLANMQKTRDVPMGSNSLGAFGLEKPYLTATATLKDGSTHVLIAGNKNPGGDSYYAQVKGQPGLFLVAIIDVDSIAQLVAQPPIATPTAVTTPLAAPTPAATATATP
ncbi:MAG TPA: DUF4340 domain-containing protein [Chloroflexota bacterium]|jgi:hypothetical protein|nr:DUF4340 domain-containing protein [Chloroflexota bacterium]